MQGKNNQRTRRQNTADKQGQLVGRGLWLGLVLGALLTAGILVFLNGSPARLFSLSSNYQKPLDQTGIRSLGQFC